MRGIPTHDSPQFVFNGTNLQTGRLVRLQKVRLADIRLVKLSNPMCGLPWPKQAMRALDIATDQARALRKSFLFAQCAEEGRVPAYSGIDCDPKSYPAPQLIKAPATIRRLARLRTRLDPFSEEEQSRLINWGWLMTDCRDAQLRDEDRAGAFGFAYSGLPARLTASGVSKGVGDVPTLEGIKRISPICRRTSAHRLAWRSIRLLRRWIIASQVSLMRGD
ncbi:MAG: hypothetical protein E5X67_06070 [Mesorhizobium sp.]|uniref:hypothetical protein n=1 Tax=Mesorhizobium sp. TaxID=1871066 RepID=UPI0011F8DBCF|nr:hypothetical protein [Mesorhizobium sp.]TIP29605.1 MAG: hypothetical protein E5X67_06070 [Mesorhizobium sp.]